MYAVLNFLGDSMNKIFLACALLISGSALRAERKVHFINDTNIVDNPKTGIKYFTFTWHVPGKPYPDDHSAKAKAKETHFVSVVDLDALSDTRSNVAKEVQSAKGNTVDVKIETAIKTGWYSKPPKPKKPLYYKGSIENVQPGTYRAKMDFDKFKIVFERVEPKEPMQLKNPVETK